jgi:hypothetical protein
MGEGCRALIAAIYRILLLRFSFCEGTARADPLVRGNVLVLRRKTLPYSRVREVFEWPVHAFTCTGRLAEDNLSYPVRWIIILSEASLDIG